MTATMTLVLALLVATVVCASVATSLRMPYAIVLVLGGAGLSLLPGLPAVELNPDLILFLFLPPLVYSSAWQIRLSGIAGESEPDLTPSYWPSAGDHRGSGHRGPVLAPWSIRSVKGSLRSERPRRKGECMSSGNEPFSWGRMPWCSGQVLPVSSVRGSRRNQRGNRHTAGF
jgi:hypothetical protein